MPGIPLCSQSLVRLLWATVATRQCNIKETMNLQTATGPCLQQDGKYFHSAVFPETDTVTSKITHMRKNITKWTIILDIIQSPVSLFISVSYLLGAAHNLSTLTPVTPVVYQPDAEHGSVISAEPCHAWYLCGASPHDSRHGGEEIQCLRSLSHYTRSVWKLVCCDCEGRACVCMCVCAECVSFVLRMYAGISAPCVTCEYVAHRGYRCKCVWRLFDAM